MQVERQNDFHHISRAKGNTKQVFQKHMQNPYKQQMKILSKNKNKADFLQK